MIVKFKAKPKDYLIASIQVTFLKNSNKILSLVAFAWVTWSNLDSGIAVAILSGIIAVFFFYLFLLTFLFINVIYRFKQLNEAYEFSLTPEKIVMKKPNITVEFDWNVIKKIIETNSTFLLIIGGVGKSTCGIPKRAFNNLTQIEEFIQLAKKKKVYTKNRFL